MDTNGTQPIEGRIMPNGFNPYIPPQPPQRPNGGPKPTLVIFTIGFLLAAIFGIYGFATALVITLAYVLIIRQGPRIR